MRVCVFERSHFHLSGKFVVSDFSAWHVFQQHFDRKTNPAGGFRVSGMHVYTFMCVCAHVTHTHTIPPPTHTHTARNDWRFIVLLPHRGVCAIGLRLCYLRPSSSAIQPQCQRQLQMHPSYRGDYCVRSINCLGALLCVFARVQ